ncbi:MAG: YkvA family protein [Bacteroides sp.]|nr:YkvA family protein [Bacteroides sp.]MCM1094907.1 YkvA family protein [Terasakiella sp.]
MFSKIKDAVGAGSRKVADFAASAPATIHTYADNFTEADMWRKLADCAVKAGHKVIEMVLTLYYALGTAPAKDKMMIAGALGYFILPVDLIPDLVPGGYSDDLAALTAIYKAVKENISEDTIAKAQSRTDALLGSHDAPAST